MGLKRRPLQRKIITDEFAGGGGASEGIKRALGRSPDVAVNHDPQALCMHEANHPETLHLVKNVLEVPPSTITKGRKIWLAWFSPDCKDHSKAKGGKPVSKKIRGLAWRAVEYAKLPEGEKPEVIILENVEEFQDWGPLMRGKDGKWRRDPERLGEIFRKFVRALRRHGYNVEWRELRGCDFGAPTIRNRLFIVGRSDGKPIVWPTPTHFPSKASSRPWPSAASIIDWTIPVHSIFLTLEEARILGVRRPLADATLDRIRAGVIRYVINAAEPFIVPITHVGDLRTYGIHEPLRTVTAAHRGEFALISPALGVNTSGHGPADPRDPLHTVTTGGQNMLMGVSLATTGHGEREGQHPRAPDPGKPLGTVVATAQNHALVAAFMAQANGGYNRTPHRAVDGPLSTITAGGGQQQLVTAFLGQANAGKNKKPRPGHDALSPLSTIGAGGGRAGMQQQLVTSHLMKLKGTCKDGQPVDEPMPTVQAMGWHMAEVRAFLMKYYGRGAPGQTLNDPLHTAGSRDTFGLVTVRGEDYQIVDIGMRMLTPRELFRAQGFHDDYVINPIYQGKPLTKTAQIRMCGNSVCPPVAEALVRANCGEQAREQMAA